MVWSGNVVGDSATPVEHRRIAPLSSVMMQGPPRGLGPGATMATTMNLPSAGHQGTAANMDADVGHVRHASAQLIPLSSIKQSSRLEATHRREKTP